MAATDKALKLGFILSATDKMSRVIDSAVKKSTDKLSAFERATGKIGRSLMKAGGLMVGAGVAITGATLGVAKSTADYGDAAMKNSQAVGVNVEDWQKLAYAAKMAGAEETELSGAMVKLGKQMKDAAAGSKTAGKVFTDLGISLKDAKGNLRAPNEIFAELSGIFGGVKDSAAKTALAYELFGRSGTKLIPLLNGGKEGLEAMGAEAEAMGIVLSKEAAEASEKFNDNLARVGTSLQGLKMQFGTALMPALDETIQKITGVIIKVSGWLRENPKLAATISAIALPLGGLLVVLGSTALLIGGVTFTTSKLILVWRVAVAAFNLGAKAITAAKNSMFVFRIQYGALVVWQKLAAAAQGLFNTALLACPVVWIIAAIVAIGTAVYLLIKHWDKVSAFFKNLWEHIKKIFAKAWDWIKTMFLNYTPYGLIFKYWDQISAWFTGLWEGAKNVFGSAWDWIKKMFLNYTAYGLIIKHWDQISGWFSNLWQGVKNIFFNAWEWVKTMFMNYTPYGLIFKHWDQIKEWFAGLWDWVKNDIVTTWENIAAFFTSLNPVEWISKIWEKVGEYFTELKGRFFNWGKELIRGLIDGITAFAKKAVDSVKDLGSSIAGKFKSLLGINSPSRLFMEYGVNITEGLTGGIEKGTTEVGNTTGSLAGSAIEGVGQSIQTSTTRQNNINTGGGLTLNYSPTIHISGSSETVKQDFSKMLKNHSSDIWDIMQRHFEEKQRLAF